MKKSFCYLILFLIGCSTSYSQDLIWNTAAIPNTSTAFNFGAIGTPLSTVTYAVTGAGNFTAGPLRFTTAQSDIAWRTAITFGAITDLKIYTFTFSPAVCGISFKLYDIDGDNTNGDRAIVTANNSGTPQNITITALDPGFAGGAPTITGSGTNTATATGTQGNQTDDRVQVSIPGCITTLVIQYGNNPAGAAGGRSFSIGDMGWVGLLPVNLTSFSGQRLNNRNIELTWKTENAINLNRFEIERSGDGINYNVLGSVHFANISNSNYSFIDAGPLTGTGFYRLRIVDVDNSVTYSPIITVKQITENKNNLTILPNPASNYIILTTGSNEVIENFLIVDMSGRMVKESKTAINKIDISNFLKGLYKIKLRTKTGSIFTGTFIKQ